LFILSLNLTTGLVQVKAATQTIEIKATQDAYVSQDYPDTNYGSNTSLRVHKTLPREDVFLYFDISSMVEQNFSSVMLRIRLFGSTATTLEVFPIEQSWDENTITWNNVPDVNTSIMCSQYFTAGLGFRYVNVTTIVLNWTSIIMPNFGFYLRTTINGLAFFAKEYTNEDYHPTLEFIVPAEDSPQPPPIIAGFEITITFLGMISVIFILIINKRKITRILN
jgi:hypothetical protein